MQQHHDDPLVPARRPRRGGEPFLQAATAVLDAHPNARAIHVDQMLE